MKYVNDLMNDNSIVFLCEHWLRPNEISHIAKNSLEPFWTHLKSSIDPTEVLIGRPYGGCGFVCKKLSGIVYRPIPCSSDRLCGLEIIVNQRPVLSIFGVYLPCDDHRLLSHESYLECLHELQGYIEHCESGPYMVVGDFNTKLPQSKVLAQRWSSARGFSPRSTMLYDFCCDNDLCVMNFAFTQPVNYTFCRCNAKSYIDHVLVSECLSSCVLDCRILTDCPDNLSDHLPIRCSLQFPSHDLCSPPGPSPALPFHFPRPNWKDPASQERYRESLSRKLASVHSPDFRHVSSPVEASTAVNALYSSISSSIHDAAQEATSAISHCTRLAHQKHWWNGDCTTARNRSRLFFRIWKDMGRPLHGAAYECYKEARRSYRRTCRSATNSGIQKTYRLMDALYQTKCPGKFWNMVKKTRTSKSSHDAIGITELTSHFSRKFSAAELRNDFLKEADRKVQAKHETLSAHLFNNVTVSYHHVKRLITKLRLGCAPGIDGVSAEHLRYAANTDLPFLLSLLFTLCLRAGCLPDVFGKGLLVPILKKPHLDASKPSNYRPITVSSTTSKLLELYIMEKSNQDYDPSQFGFVSHRGTTTAISLAHDVSSYCVSRGSPVYLCSLDAEGAFDAIPFPVLFVKAAEAMPDCCWRLMYNWYSSMEVYIKWNGSLGQRIPVLKGTRQGGLSSPFLFNMFYKSLISSLNAASCGISIKGSNYNVFCYADDILIASTTVTGLQRLIDICVEYVSSHGLRFNPAKTNCLTFGRPTLASQPHWTIENERLANVDEILYLGAILRDDRGSSHTNRRVQSAQKSYYGLQGAGLCFRGVTPDVASHLYSVGVRTVLTYGCEALYLNKKCVKNLESTQGKLIKAFLGLRKTSHTTPLISALNIPSVATSIGLASLDLLRSCLRHSSSASSFHSSLLCSVRPFSAFNCLAQRCVDYAATHSFNLMDYVFNDSHRLFLKKKLKHVEPNGISDSIRILFNDFNDLTRNIVQLLVNPF